MTASAQVPRRWTRYSLANRAMALVTLALLPLGIIAVWQTDRLLVQQRNASERALIAVTEDAAGRERQVIERAIGAAVAMGNTAHALLADPSDCARALHQFERSSSLYSHAGFFPADGRAPCLSDPSPDLATDNDLRDLIDQRKMGLYARRGPEGDDGSYLVVATPAFQGSDYVGHLRLEISYANFEPAADGMEGERPLGLVTFNAEGKILTSERRLDSARDFLPGNTDLAELRTTKPRSFHGTSGSGETRAFAVVPMVPGVVYAIGTWKTDAAVLALDQSYWITIALAVLMWLASVVVVFLIMQVLVIRGLRRLDRQLVRFRARRILPQGEILGRGELYDLESSFRDLAETILHDEAHLEDAVHEKGVLLKEVHHRVKNNLQLINSIINMILRGARSSETQIVVRRLQDRVMALASVHRSIYQAQTMDRIDASEIVREIVNQSIALGLPRDSKVDVELDLGPVTLCPDQAMPLSMLVSEGITNALKYVGGEAPWIRVHLHEQAQQEQDQQVARLSIRNSLPDETNDSEGTGLGTQLVRAFTNQLEGRLHVETTDAEHVLEVTFRVADFSPEPSDLPAVAE